MPFSPLGAFDGVALFVVSAGAATLAWMLAAERRRCAKAEEDLADAEKRVSKEHEKTSIAERELEAERVRMAPITEGHQHLLVSLSRGFQEISVAKDAAAVHRTVAETAEHVFDASQVMVFAADPSSARDYVLAAVGGQRGSPWNLGARINDTMGRVGLVSRRRAAMDRSQFESEPPVVREQLDATEPADFVVEVAVPLIVGSNVAAIVSLGGSTLTLESTRSGLELLAAHAASHLRVLDAAARIDRLRNTDELSGLGSKGWLVAEGSEIVYRCRNENAPAAVLMFAIDDFRGYVTRTGHGAGDRLLRGVAQALSKACGGKLLLARWSGAEFIALAPRMNSREAIIFTERLRAAVASADWPSGESQPRGRLTMSAGISFLASNVKNLDAMIEVAAEALASARLDGDTTHAAADENAGTAEMMATQDVFTEPTGSDLDRTQ